MSEAPKLGCKFCFYIFDVTQGREYINHLWRFHRDELQEKLNQVVEETHRVENLPK